MKWFDLASCKGKDNTMFFGNENGNVPSDVARKVKRICSECPVSFECLNFAIENEEQYGIWGGLTAKERKSIIKTYGKISANDIRKIVTINVREVSS